MGRIIVFTGKGGVGKTSVAAAHAIHSAKEGVKTLILSTDMAHNLGDIFEMPLGKTICNVTQEGSFLNDDKGTEGRVPAFYYLHNNPQ